MNPILPEQSAREECLKLIEELDSSPLGEALMKEGHGRMFGILVCTDGTVLRSFSGELEGELSAEGFVPPLFDIAKYRAILYSYDILADDAALRAAPACFEALRGDYPVRREPGAFSVRLQGGTQEMAERLSALGFRT